MAWDDEEGAEIYGREKADLVDEAGNKMHLSIVPEKNSWRIKVDYNVPNHPVQVMMLDGWYPSKFAVIQDLPLMLNVIKGSGWKEVQ